MGLPAWQVLGLVFVASLLVSLAGALAIGPLEPCYYPCLTVYPKRYICEYSST